MIYLVRKSKWCFYLKNVTSNILNKAYPSLVLNTFNYVHYAVVHLSLFYLPLELLSFEIETYKFQLARMY